MSGETWKLLSPTCPRLGAMRLASASRFVSSTQSGTREIGRDIGRGRLGARAQCKDRPVDVVPNLPEPVAAAEPGRKPSILVVLGDDIGSECQRLDHEQRCKGPYAGELTCTP